MIGDSDLTVRQNSELPPNRLLGHDKNHVNAISGRLNYYVVLLLFSLSVASILFLMTY